MSGLFGTPVAAESSAWRSLFSVREFTIEAVARIGRLGGVLYLVAGVGALGLVVNNQSRIDNVTGVAIVSSLNVALGVALLVVAAFPPVRLLERTYPVLAYAITFYAGIAITANLYFAGPDLFAIGALVYLLAPIFGFYMLSRTGALALVASVGAEYAFLLVVQQSALAPLGQWLFFMAMLTTAAVLVGDLVRRSDLLAASEQRARRELAEVNRGLEERVQAQVAELEKLNRLRRFLSPQVADVVMSSGSEHMLAPHRSDIAVFFCDLRGFTRFTSKAEPEEVLDVINAYYEVVGRLLHQHNGTVGGFAGDGIMAYFNDPVPCETPALTAVTMALALRDEMRELVAQWHNRGYDLGYGVGIAYGYATLGVVGFEGRHDYSPLGSVVNLGARLCAQAATEQILIDQRVRAVISSACETNAIGNLTLKGFQEPITVSEVLHTHATKPH